MKISLILNRKNNKTQAELVFWGKTDRQKNIEEGGE